jgi:hypothetical protein
MPTQEEINAGQTGAAKDTAAAKAKQNNNNQAAKDTAAAKSKQNGGDGGTSARMSQRESAAGLYLAGNDTISAGRGGVGPTFSDREAAAGLTNTMSGRVAMNATNPDFPTVGTPSGNDLFESVMVNAGGGGGGGGLAGLEIIWSDESTTFITASQAYSGYGGSGYWSLVLPIVSSAFTKVYSFDAGTTISSSSEYRLRLYTPYTNSSGDTAVTKISALGQYRAMIICVNGAGRAVLIKVG